MDVILIIILLDVFMVVLFIIEVSNINMVDKMVFIDILNRDIFFIFIMLKVSSKFIDMVFFVCIDILLLILVIKFIL